LKFLIAILSLLRLETRQLIRDGSKSLLILVLVLLPVASLIWVGTVLSICEPTAAEVVRSSMGRASIAITGLDEPLRFQRAESLLGEASQHALLYRGSEEVVSKGRSLATALVAVQPVDGHSIGVATGVIDLLHGDFACNSGEVALSPQIMKQHDLRLGDFVVLAYGTQRKITGIIVDRENTKAAIVQRTPFYSERGGQCSLLSQINLTKQATVVEALLREGFQVTTSQKLEGDVDGLTVGFVFVGSVIGFFEAALIIGAAYSISVKRRQREFGLIASIGGRSFQIVTAMMTSAVLLAFTAGCIGTGVGLSLAFLTYPFLDQWNHRWNGPFEISWLQVVAAISMGIGAAAAAVFVPAWRAGRVSVRESLHSAGPDVQMKERHSVWGILGLSAAMLMICWPDIAEYLVGPTRLILIPIAVMCGIVLMVPAVLSVGYWLAPSGPVAYRIALRDTVRFRNRNAVATVAIFTAMSVCVATAILTSSLRETLAQFPAPLRDDQLLISGPAAENVAKLLNEATRPLAMSPLMAAYRNGQPLRVKSTTENSLGERSSWIAVGDQSLCRSLGGEASIAEFENGSLLFLYQQRPSKDPAVSTWIDQEVVAFDKVSYVMLTQASQGPVGVISESSTAASQLQTGPPPSKSMIPWILRYQESIDAEVLKSANEIAAEFPGTTIQAASGQDQLLRYAFLAALSVSTILGIVVVLVSMALNFAESQAEFDILTLLGAAVAQMRWVVLLRAFYLSALGCLLAIPCGVVIALSLFEATNFPLKWVFPWLDILLIMSITPAVIAIAVGMLLRPWRCKITLSKFEV
jgi:ABC-type antimicrobial peptide transport system permease subunit